MNEFYTNVAKRGNKMLVRGYRDGKRFSGRVPFSPTLYLPTKEDTKYKTIHGDPVAPKKFANNGDMWEFVRKYRDVENFNYYGMEDPIYQFIHEQFPNIKHDPKKIRVCFLDIEVDSTGGYPNMDTADKEITAITMMYDKITIAFGYGDFDVPDESIKYIKCADEFDLVKKFLKLWESSVYCPDVVTGWNIEFFDIPYLYTRIARLFDVATAKRMSPWGMFNERTLTMFGRDHKAYYPVGIAVLDYINMYKKFVAVLKPQESYKLDHIAFVELGEKKLDYSDYGSLHALASENHQMFMEYNVRDCELVKRIDDKLKLLDLVYTIAYSSGVNFEASLGTVQQWDVAIYRYLMDQCIVIPKKVRNEADRKPVGAFVKEPIPGLYNWVVSFDLTSLYPHIIMQYNIGPDTFHKQATKDFTIEELIENKHKDNIEDGYSFAANSCLYDNSKVSFLSQLMKQLFLERKSVKREMLDLEQRRADGENGLDGEIDRLDTLQYAIKVRLNSAYGALGNQHFRWYDIKYAESITKSGQLSIKWIATIINKFLNNKFDTNKDYVIYIDTDSVYVDMSQIAHDADKLAEFSDGIMQKLINAAYEKLAKQMNAKEQAMFMDREVIVDRIVFKGKKRYMMNMLYNEDVKYNEPKTKIKGIDSVRSSTPSACRDAIKTAVNIILQQSEDELHKFVGNFKNAYLQQDLADIARNSSVNGLDKYSDKDAIYAPKTPIYVRGALLYNHHLKAQGIDTKYENIFDGAKVKYVYLKMPNPIGENVISWDGKLPTEFQLEDYIDYDTQFRKTFLDPIEEILNVIGWSSEPRHSMDGFWE